MTTLRAEAISLGESVVMGLAGSAPGFSIATATAVLLGTAGLLSINALVVFALPMLGIAVAYQGLNPSGPSAGAAYSWTTRAFGRQAGFASGWAVLVSSLIFMVTGSLTLGTAVVDIVAPQSGNDLVATVGVGVACYVAIGLVLVAGIAITSRVQVAMTAVEFLILAVIASAALVHVARVGAVHAPSLAWLGFGYTGSQFAATALVVVFFYWGWDVTSNLGEETRGTATNAAGRGGLIAVLVTIAIFLAYVAIALMLFPLGRAEGYSTNIVYQIALAAGLGTVGAKFASLAVAISSVATLETSMLQFSRGLYAMARDRALPPRFAAIDPRTRTPIRAMGVVIIMGVAIVGGAALLPDAGTVMADSVNASAVQVCFYYGLTGLNCAWVHRGAWRTAPGRWVLYVALPAASALALWALGVHAVLTFDRLTNGVGIGGLVAGFAFYRRGGWRGEREVPRAT